MLRSSQARSASQFAARIPVSSLLTTLSLSYSLWILLECGLGDHSTECTLVCTFIPFLPCPFRALFSSLILMHTADTLFSIYLVHASWWDSVVCRLMGFTFALDFVVCLVCPSIVPHTSLNTQILTTYLHLISWWPSKCPEALPVPWEIFWWCHFVVSACPFSSFLLALLPLFVISCDKPLFPLS